MAQQLQDLNWRTEMCIVTSDMTILRARFLIFLRSRNINICFCLCTSLNQLCLIWFTLTSDNYIVVLQNSIQSVHPFSIARVLTMVVLCQLTGQEPWYTLEYLPANHIICYIIVKCFWSPAMAWLVIGNLASLCLRPGHTLLPTQG